MHLRPFRPVQLLISVQIALICKWSGVHLQMVHAPRANGRPSISARTPDHFANQAATIRKCPGVHFDMGRVASANGRLFISKCSSVHLQMLAGAYGCPPGSTALRWGSGIKWPGVHLMVTPR